MWLERLEAKRDMRIAVEQLAIQEGGKAVKHNLAYARLLAESFTESYNEFCKWAESLNSI